MFKIKKVLSLALSFVLVVVSVFAVDIIHPTTEVSAVSNDYAPQLMNLSLYDDSKNLAVTSTADKTEASLMTESGELSEQWRIDYCGANSNGNYYKIVNAASGRLLTPYGYSTDSDTSVVIYGNENDHSQYWYISPVSKDNYGNDLHYKIVNYADSNMALTSNGTATVLKKYNGANNQKWLLNCAGLDGFAGYSKDNSGNVKASVTGGLLGPTVEVSTFDELKAECTNNTTETIVITKDISKTGNYLVSGNGRLYWRENTIYIHPNKTVIGSYAAHSTYNVYFATYPTESYGNGSNFIIKNLTVSHDTELNADNIYDFPCGINIWIDHITFEGHTKLDSASTGLVDWDKFLCIYQDANFATVSNCTFGHHHYGCLYGYPADSEENYQTYNGKPYITLVSNYYKDCITRAPGLLRYGFYHSFNNYVYDVSLGYTLYTASTLYDECNYYDGGGNSGKIVNDAPGQGGGDDVSDKHLCSYAMSGSVLTNSKYTLTPTYALTTSWRPSGNYKYKTKNAESAKNYCSAYSGSQSSNNTMNFNNYASAGVTSATYMTAPEESWETTLTPAVMALDAYYMIKNANSGLYLDVEGGTAKGGTNVQQWGANSASAQNTWRFVLAEDGYYYIQSMVGDKTYVMDVTGGKTANGTNIEIYNYKGNDNQKFMIFANADGTYKICPKIGNSSAFVEIASASVSSGGNCQIWEKTGSECQNWILEEVSYAGEIMDTSVNYMFKNVNSGLYLEVANGSDTDGANVQQWEANGSGENKSAEWNSWTLKPATDDLYYIVSNLPNKKYLTINNENAEISKRDTSNNKQMVRFVKNPDGSYSIVTRVSYNKTSGRYTKALEVAGAGTVSGANVQQWDINGVNCQNWMVETFVTTTTTKATTTTTKTTTTTTTITTVPKQVKGDVNVDGKFNTEDIVMMQNWLLQKSNIIKAEAGDMNEDGIINVFDLCIMKHLVK